MSRANSVLGRVKSEPVGNENSIIQAFRFQVYHTDFIQQDDSHHCLLAWLADNVPSLHDVSPSDSSEPQPTGRF